MVVHSSGWNGFQASATQKRDMSATSPRAHRKTSREELRLHEKEVLVDKLAKSNAESHARTKQVRVIRHNSRTARVHAVSNVTNN
jgi:hypothetical protein